MQIQYRLTREFMARDVRELFQSVDWMWANHPEKLCQAMAHSDRVVSAWAGDELIGLMNALSDGALTVYFHFLLVKPRYQGQGIGRTLVREMLTHYSAIPRKVLVGEQEALGFYEKCGFTATEGALPLLLTTPMAD